MNIENTPTIVEVQPPQGTAEGNGHHPHTVNVTIDGRQVPVDAGEYVVSELKLMLGVPPEYELEHIDHGKFEPLADAALFKVHHVEEFISHVRTGTSS